MQPRREAECAADALRWSRLIPLLAVVCWLTVSVAKAGFRTGNDLFNECGNDVGASSHNWFYSGTCAGYIIGVADALWSARAICVPDGV
jgi:hypothetical protein